MYTYRCHQLLRNPFLSSLLPTFKLLPNKFSIIMLFSVSRVMLHVLLRIRTGTSTMHLIPYITVRIASLHFKPTLHIISFRLNPPITLSSTYYANGTHFTTPFCFAQYSYTGCIRYIIFCPLYTIPDKKLYTGFYSTPFVLSTKKISTNQM